MEISHKPIITGERETEKEEGIKNIVHTWYGRKGIMGVLPAKETPELDFNGG